MDMLPTLHSNKHIADFIATRVEAAATAHEEGRDLERDTLLSSALAMAKEADDQESLGFLYAVIQSPRSTATPKKNHDRPE